jgi:hypothetical protein
MGMQDAPGELLEAFEVRHLGVEKWPQALIT